MLNKWYRWFLLFAVIVNAGSLFIDILEPDGALYATIAKTIARSGDFINLRVDGMDWLDKPHFPFWMAAVSFKIFGFHAFAYKLPALLFWAIGAAYTARLASTLYGRTVAQLSTLLYVSAAHLVISNNDVRAEPYLTGLVIGAVYHFYKLSRIGFPLRAADPGSDFSRLVPSASRAMAFHLIAGALLAACACMTKGPFVLITIAAAFIPDWILRREWRQFTGIRWWIVLAAIALFITPELYCLYTQFDLHPEKQVFGRYGVSGIRFFFWDSQFGRFFNTGPIKGSGDPFFYFHTVLWAFLPWSLLLYAAVVQKCRSAVRTAPGRTTSSQAPSGDIASVADGTAYSYRLASSAAASAAPGAYLCLGAVLVSFALFSLSRFQLPHYLNLLFPFFSILTAAWLHEDHAPLTDKGIRTTQGVINVLLPVLVLTICWWYHFNGWPLIAAVVIFLSLLSFLLFRGPSPAATVLRSGAVALVAFAFVNLTLYPAILRYQAGTQAGRFIGTYSSGIAMPDADRANKTSLASGVDGAEEAIYMLREGPANYSFTFYCPYPVQRITMDSLRSMAATHSGHVVVFTPNALADTLRAKGVHLTTLRQFPNFHISQLTGDFIDYRTRNSTLEWYSLMEVMR